jgi:hypothetical protein
MDGMVWMNSSVSGYRLLADILNMVMGLRVPKTLEIS